MYEFTEEECIMGGAGQSPVDARVLDNLGLARKVAYRYRNTQMELEDLEQTARIGLIKAARAYDPERGIQFSTFAWRLMENEINVALHKVRRQNREITALDDDTKEDTRSILETLAAKDDVEGTVLHKELFRDALTYLADVPERNRCWIIRYLFLEERQKDIAGRSGVTQAHVSRAIKKELQKIRKKMEERDL